jgi:hypothetical protein
MRSSPDRTATLATFGDDGDPIKARMRYTRTWRHDGTRWCIIAAHASVLVDDPRSG